MVNGFFSYRRSTEMEFRKSKSKAVVHKVGIDCTAWPCECDTVLCPFEETFRSFLRRLRHILCCGGGEKL